MVRQKTNNKKTCNHGKQFNITSSPINLSYNIELAFASSIPGGLYLSVCVPLSSFLGLSLPLATTKVCL